MLVLYIIVVVNLAFGEEMTDGFMIHGDFQRKQIFECPKYMFFEIASSRRTAPVCTFAMDLKCFKLKHQRAVYTRHPLKQFDH